MVRKRPSVATPTTPDVLPAQPPYPFPFGWRFATETRPDGTEACVQVPLTLDDVLHPREGDQVSQNTQQSRDGHYLVSVLKWRLADSPRALVLWDCLVNWGIEGLGHHSPDVSVFEGVVDPKRRRGSFAIAEEKARTVLVVVSPNDNYRQARDNDVVAKVREYYRAGVPLYVIVDQEKEDGPRELVGYQRGPRNFVPLPLDNEGRLLLEPLRLQVALRDELVVCFDADTGEEIGDPTATAEALEAAKARAAADAQAVAAAEGRATAAEDALAAAQARIRELESRVPPEQEKDSAN